jgi:hypothetical protein
VATFDYHRVYTDDDGETHFEDVRVPISELDFAPPAAPLNFAALGDAVSLAVISNDKEWRGDDFHPAPARQFIFVLSGSGSVTVSDGETRSGGPGLTFLLEDTHGRGHSSRFFEDVQALVVRVPDSDGGGRPV